MLWNYESERTAAHRFPGELHTSGVGSGANYQLPMSKGHHVLPMFAAWDEYYAEAPLKIPIGPQVLVHVGPCFHLPGQPIFWVAQF